MMQWRENGKSTESDSVSHALERAGEDLRGSFKVFTRSEDCLFHRSLHNWDLKVLL